jgi:hypothetical protein
MLAGSVADLDTPMEIYESMIDTIDSARHERFMREIGVRREWERFLFSTQDEPTDDF